MKETDLISRGQLICYAAAAALGMIAAVVFSFIKPGNFARVEPASIPLSSSAIGYDGFYRVATKLGLPARPKEQGTVRLIIDPHEEEPTQKGETVVVLPQWEGTVRRNRQGWVKEIQPIPRERLQAILTKWGLDERTVIKSNPDRRTVLRADRSGKYKTFVTSPQLIQSTDPRVTPQLAFRDAALIAVFERAESKIWIISDPDLLNNAGLALHYTTGERVQNLEFALSRIEQILHGRSLTLSGTETVQPLAFTKMGEPLVRFPWNLGAVALLMASGVLLWAGAVRFAPPILEPAHARVGKKTLIEVSTGMLVGSTSSAELLHAYTDSVLREAAHTLHAPAALAGDALLHWFDRVAARRRLELELAPLVAEIHKIAPDDAATALRLARALHLWRIRLCEH